MTTLNVIDQKESLQLKKIPDLIPIMSVPQTEMQIYKSRSPAPKNKEVFADLSDVASSPRQITANDVPLESVSVVGNYETCVSSLYVEEILSLSSERKPDENSFSDMFDNTSSNVSTAIKPIIDSKLDAATVTSVADIFQCSSCNESFDNISTLTSHIATHVRNIIKVKKCTYKCDECVFITNNLKEFKAHKMSHVACESYCCDECEYKCNSKSALDVHLQAHQSPMFTCKLCGFETNLILALQRHIIGHQTYNCFVCSEYQPDLVKLRKHLIVHDGVKLLACNLCDFQSDHFTTLVSHTEIHKFKCKCCEFSCDTTDDLATHESTHDGVPKDIINKCHCGRTFLLHTNLKLHQINCIKNKTNVQNEKLSQSIALESSESSSLHGNLPKSTAMKHSSEITSSAAIPVKIYKNSNSPSDIISRAWNATDEKLNTSTVSDYPPIDIPVKQMPAALSSIVTSMNTESNESSNITEDLPVRLKSKSESNQQGCINSNGEPFNATSPLQKQLTQLAVVLERLPAPSAGLSISNAGTKSSSPLNKTATNSVNRFTSVSKRKLHEDPSTKLKIYKSKPSSSAYSSKKQKPICPICNCKFEGEKLLKRHMNESHSKVLSCENCVFKTTSEKHLLSHNRACNTDGVFITQKVQTDGSVNKEFVCRICFMSAITLLAIKHHMVSHMKGKNLNCLVCQETCNSNNKLTTHVLKHKHVSAKICNNCSFYSYSDNEYKEHLMTHLSKKEFACNECHTSYDNESDLMEHNNNSKKLALGCDLCEYSADTDCSLTTHRTEHKGQKKTQEIKIESYSEDNEADEVPVDSGSPKLYCSFCPYSTCSRALYRSHKLTHDDSNLYLCDICNERFSLFSSLKNHVQKHLNPDYHIQKYACTECKEEFEDEKEVLDHKISHSKMYMCSKCDFTSNDQSSLNEHIIVHFMPYVCKSCTFTCKLAKELKIHELTHRLERVYSCKYCSMNFKGNSQLEEHLQTAHPAMSKKSLLCDHCSYSTTIHYRMELHMKKHTVETFLCNVCEFSAPKRYLLNHHLRTRHPQTEELGPLPARFLKKIYPCDLCKFTCEELKILQEHKLIHKQERPFPCDLCSHTCGSLLELKVHKYFHSDRKSYHCEQCDYVCDYPWRLKAHQRIHKDDRPFSCGICDFKTKSDRYLKIHELIHKEKPFGCNVCDKRFLVKANLRLHATKHSDRKQFQCDRCNYTTHSLPYLRTHTRVHDNIKKEYCCDECKYITNSLYRLNKHKSYHTGQRPFSTNPLNVNSRMEKADQDENTDNLLNGDFNDETESTEDCGGNLLDTKEIVVPDINKRVVKTRDTSHLEISQLEVVNCNDIENDNDIEYQVAVVDTNQDDEIVIADETVQFQVETENDSSVNGDNEVDYQGNQLLVIGDDDKIKTVGQISEHQFDVQQDEVLETDLIEDTDSDQVHQLIIVGNVTGIFKELDENPDHNQTSSSETKNKVLVANERKRNLSCPSCSFSSCDSVLMAQHRLLHRGEKPYKCSECHYAAASKILLKFHKESHLGIKRYFCAICAFATNYLSTLTKHQMRHVQNKPFLCEICSRACSTANALEKHLEIHTTVRKFTCKECKETFHSISLLNKHKLASHAPQVEKDSKPHACSVCYSTFRHKSNLLEHELVHHEERPFRCNECDYTCKRQKQLRVHHLWHHEEKPYKCQGCNKGFVNIKIFERHVNFHARIQSSDPTGQARKAGHIIEKEKLVYAMKEFNCSECDKKFNSVHMLELHRESHLKVISEKLFECDQCPYTTNQKRYLKKHVEYHSLPRSSFECDMCLFTTTFPGHLRKHKLLHIKKDEAEEATNDNSFVRKKLYPCNKCDFSTDDLSEFDQHKESHITNPNFSCDQCLFTTDVYSKLKSHMVIHSEVKQYGCDMCNFTTNYSLYLKEHKLSHASEEWSKCAICPLVFKHVSDLNIHKLSHFTEEKK